MVFVADSGMVTIISISPNGKGHFENKILINSLQPLRKALDLKPITIRVYKSGYLKGSKNI